MTIRSYKNYLLNLENKKKPSLLKKSAIITTLVLFIIFGTISALIFYQYQKKPQISAHDQYLQIASGGFTATKQSIEEILASFKVAGSKIQTVDLSKEATSSSLGFFVTLDDLNKTLSKIEVAKKNIAFQKELLGKKPPPANYLKLDSDLTNYYLNSEKLLGEVYQDHLFVKEIVLASGPNFHLPAFTDETLWRIGNKEAISQYYQKTKAEADSTLANLSKLSISEDFKNYLDTQIAYLELIVKVSNNVIGILAVEDEPNTENATQIEKAYQAVIGARRENEALSQRLVGERLKIVDLKQNLAKFAPVKITQDSIDAQFADIQSPNPEQNDLTTWLSKFTGSIKSFSFWGVYK